jgi:AMP phosphorylase
MNLHLVVVPLGIESGGKFIVVIDDKVAEALGTHSLDRVDLEFKGRHALAIVNVAEGFKRGSIGIYEEVRKVLDVGPGEKVNVKMAERPKSLGYIREKIAGRKLDRSEMKTIVKDVVERRLSDVEVASFVTALEIYGICMDEAESLTRGMIETGKKLNFKRKPILDKHSIGGVPGDKTTMLVVPIVAAAGYTIPKTSSRSITSPAGTADRVEPLCPVELSLNEIYDVVEKTNGCMVWGGTLDLAPADDLFITVENPLSIDPLLLPSILSKKKAAGSQYIVIDIPTGRGAKIETQTEAYHLANDFIELGRRLGLHIECASTFGGQPVGYAVGPALEAREALETIMGNGAEDLKNKAVTLAGTLFQMVGENDGVRIARELFHSKKAERKLREIIEAQGGNPKIKPEEIPVGEKVYDYCSENDGKVLWITNSAIVQIAKEAGAPKDKGAGVILKAKMGNSVKKGQTLLQIYAENNTKLNAAIDLISGLNAFAIGRKFEENMLLERISARKLHERRYLLER